ncbi:2-hydroxyacid dehydrogenase family protein [Peptoniphilus sp. oral taxon 386]|uniref:2-hydroxyacid dehydrogenase family protein n=1 Tax=Peptoniphilus sp. oral taxon 386 TaxID=652713 RepID=UPI0001DA9AD8|nr:2-hydroxyacid dehydrogenase family protein [Peptoniphilus sp. oral taxon 386]EFI42034.1 glyoxylate reductase [Peptoniphilus sp. oral taxon 386 str. F0131]
MKIFVTSKVPKRSLRILEENFELDYNDSLVPLTKEQIIDRIGNVDGLLCPLSDKIDSDIMGKSKNLKIIANYGAGFDNIDIETAKNMGITVTNSPTSSSAVSTAEFTFALILALSRRLISGEKSLKAGEFLGWRPTYFLGNELRNKTLGIVGMGNIGKNLAKRALSFEMNVIYYSRNRKNDIENMGVVYKELEDVIKESDFLSLHTAFSPELRHMISIREFDLMKKSAYLINAARGPLVDEKALADAIRSEKIAGAALDVYEFEPSVSKELFEFENVLLEPHLGNATYEAREEMGFIAVNNLIDFKNGKVPRNKIV